MLVKQAMKKILSKTVKTREIINNIHYNIAKKTIFCYVKFSFIKMSGLF